MCGASAAFVYQAFPIPLKINRQVWPRGYFIPPKLSPVQLAKGIKSLKSITKSQAQFETFKKEFIPDEQLERISQIIRGLEQEDEFAIICRRMGTCQSLVGIDQTPFLTNELEKPPDFLATFAPTYHVEDKRANLTYKCFIEVKSSQDHTYKISKKDFFQRVNFAKRYNLPLIFAVRLLPLVPLMLLAWLIILFKICRP